MTTSQELIFRTDLNCSFVDTTYMAISGRLYVPGISQPVVKHLEMIMDWQQDLGSFITKLDDFVLPYIKKTLIMFQPILFLEISRSTAKFSVVGQVSGTVLVFSIIKIPISCDLPDDMSLSSPSRVMSPGYHPSVRTRKG